MMVIMVMMVRLIVGNDGQDHHDGYDGCECFRSLTHQGSASGSLDPIMRSVSRESSQNRGHEPASQNGLRH